MAVLGIACLAYGFSIMRMRTGSAFFGVWYLLGICAVAWACAVATGLWAAWPAFLRGLVCCVALAFVCGALALGAYAMRFARKGAAAANADEPAWIIVLGAQVRSSGQPSRVLRYRLDSAAAYLSQHPTCKVAVSGGKGSNEPVAEAVCMGDYLEQCGIAEERIVREARSKNTQQNLQFSAEELATRKVDVSRTRIGVLTSDFHVYRACGIARRQGYGHVVGLPAPSKARYLPNNLLRECLCIVKDKLVGNL